MVYDPIRDCDVPSPATSLQNPSPWADTPTGDRLTASATYPPGFQNDRRSPGVFRSSSGGLRGLLNDEESGSRASSVRGSFSSTGADDPVPQSQSRSRNIHNLVNEAAPPISQSSSHSSMAYTSHSHHSPGPKPYSLLDHDGFLAPTTPASGYPRSSRSPYPLNSPANLAHPLPHELHNTYRSPHPYPHESLPLRSPSISVSPRHQLQNLPPQQTLSRPGSSSSSAFAFETPRHPHESPSYAYQQLSDPYHRPRSGSRKTDGPSRRPSTSTSYAPRPVRSPSPVARLPYAPTQRISAPSSLLHPISNAEVEHLKFQGLSNNPLRGKLKRPPPTWSGVTPSPSLHRSSGPSEAAASYFPGENGAGPSEPTPQRKASGNKRKAPAAEQSSNGSDLSRRKVSEAAYVGNNAVVANHYNSRQEVGVDAREFSPIIGLRKFNNWIKSVLIGKFAHRPPGGPGANVLDLGCGKGGDLGKWKQARISRMVGLDIADMSIEQARGRFQTMHRPGFQADFYAFDCFGRSISEIIPADTQRKGYFDNVSMQFCMHYAFESAPKVRLMLENVTRYLRNGGKFVGTIPDSNLLLQRLDELPEGETTFGNNCYSVRFVERKHKGVYGHAYHFFLEDAVEDVPEYIVDWENFLSLASEYGLQLVYKKSFSEILAEEQSSRDFGPLLAKMGVLDNQGVSNMNEDQWEAANLYMGFAFEKRE